MTTTTPTPDSIIEFLKAQPTFLADHPDLFSTLKLPSEGENVTSLAAFQAGQLRRQLSRTQQKLRMVTQTTMANMASIQQIHDLILGIIRANSFTALNKSLKSDLEEQMDVHVTKLLVTPHDALPKSISTIEADALSSLFGPNETVLLRTLTSESNCAFYGKTGSKLASDALLLLTSQTGEPLGLLALGSEDKTRFHEGMGQDLLRFFAGVLSACVERLVSQEQ